MDKQKRFVALENFLRESGMPQAALAEALKVKQATISDWLNCKTVPRPRRFSEIATLTGISVEKLKKHFFEHAA